MLSPFPRSGSVSCSFESRGFPLGEVLESRPCCSASEQTALLYHLGINLARCHASTHINWLELLIFISTDAGCSDKHTYVIASVRLVMMPCFDPQRIWMSAACGHMISRVWIWGHFMSPDTSELRAAGEKIEMEIIASFSRFFKMWISPHTSFSLFFFITIIFNFGKFRRKQIFFCDHTLNVQTVRWYLSSLGCP